MFTIRSHHVDAFLPQDEGFVRFCMEHVRSEYPDTVEHLNDQQLEQQVRASIERAQRYHFGHGTATLAFVGLAFTVSPMFDERPLIRAILERDDLPPLTRMQYLNDCVPEDEWQQAQNAGGAK